MKNLNNNLKIPTWPKRLPNESMSLNSHSTKPIKIWTWHIRLIIYIGNQYQFLIFFNWVISAYQYLNCVGLDTKNSTSLRRQSQGKDWRRGHFRICEASRASLGDESGFWSRQNWKGGFLKRRRRRRKQGESGVLQTSKVHTCVFLLPSWIRIIFCFNR